MRINKWIVSLSLGIAGFNQLAFANPTSIHEQVQVPVCLASQITMAHEVLAQNKEFQIIDMAAADIDQLVKLADKVHCGHFVNVTHQLSGPAKKTADSLLRPSKKAVIQSAAYQIQHQELVNEQLTRINPDNIWQTVTNLTQLRNRSALSLTGVEAANWLKNTFDGYAQNYQRTDTSSYFVKTGTYYKQPSLVTVIGKDIPAPAIVIGAHMDTLDGRMPGAGDDASGSATAMEVARVLLSSDIKLDRPVYIIWYAAEERGLVGSQYVVEYFQNQHIPVKAVVQFDMTGYRVHASDPTMWVYTDYVNPSLSAYVAELIQTYVQVPVDYSECGYGCSDHASWNALGIPATFPCESNFDEHNPYIHTSSDTMSLLNLDHMTNFTKLGLAFAIELAKD